MSTHRLLLLLIAGLVLTSHDMYLKLDHYFLPPDSPATIQLFNGTFYESDNVITRDRMADVSLIGNGQRMRVDSSQWTEQDKVTLLHFTTGAAGTWVAGLSTRARNIEMSADDFNAYLEHDGVLDMLEQRQQNNSLDQAAVERYAKHVKAIFQVGSTSSNDWQTQLGYPLEFIPLENPYDLHPGHQLPVELRFEGQPLANQLVYIDRAGDAADLHTHDDGTTHSHTEGVIQLRTDEHGQLNIPIDAQGTWYLRTIHLVNTDTSGLTHISNWATLTFAIGEGHSHEHEAAHTHVEHEAGGIPNYLFFLVSALLIAGLFLWFNRRSS